MSLRTNMKKITDYIFTGQKNYQENNVSAFKKIFLFLFVSVMAVYGCETIRSAKQIMPIKEYEKLLLGRLDANYIGTSNCLSACHYHDKIRRDFEASTMGAQMSVKSGMPLVNCESCHGPGSLHAESSGDKKLITRSSAEACFSCHTDKRAQFGLQFHHPVPEGRMSCTDCHQVHAPSAQDIGRTSLQRPNEKCFKCHKEFKGPFVFEHDPMREGCQVCHEPHGGVYEKLLVADQNTLCLRCHWEGSINTPEGNIGGVAHGTGHPGPPAEGNYPVGQGTECIDHHRAVHGSNIWKTYNR